MSLKAVNNLETNKYELEIVIPKKDFDDAIQKAYQKNVDKINVPGFRKGKAPKGIIEKMYGASVFYDDAIDIVLPTLYKDALDESKLEAVARPEIEVANIDEDGVVVKATIFTKPVPTVGEYNGLKVSKKAVNVENSEIDAEINVTRERNGRMLTAEGRSAVMNDTVVFDFEGFVDGKTFEGGKSENFSLVLGSGQFIPGFEEQMVGHNVGEEFDVNISFPEDYHVENLKGQPAVFKIKLHEVKKFELPELDDDFAKDVSEFDTFVEYRDSIKAKITDRKEKAADSELETMIEDAIVAITEVDVPNVMIEDEVEHYISDYDQRLKMQGGSLDMYFKYTGMNLDQLKEQFKPRAERAIKCRLALEKIAETEKFVVTDDMFEVEYKKIADSYGIDVDTVKKSVTDEMLVGDIKTRMAFDKVKEAAEITVE
ncbi:MAG: trigger factor [Clostridiales bacterium GWF2_38_85]|nr:MAG: trigger factor [Clostridiales bacterium GWF2_38_85]HBL84157.1 trigger factor [Clostridiales bacterium]